MRYVLKVHLHEIVKAGFPSIGLRSLSLRLQKRYTEVELAREKVENLE